MDQVAQHHVTCNSRSRMGTALPPLRRSKRDIVCSVGSGIEHAEGGGSGSTLEGFQIWVNVPSARKMDKPCYGTEPPASIPLLQFSNGASARVLAGSCGDGVGPFKTVTPVHMVDYCLPAATSLQHHVPVQLDNALVFCYRGCGRVSGCAVKENSITLLDAACDARDVTLESDRSASSGALAAVHIHSCCSGACFIVFAGKRLKQPIAWRGPFVMTTQVSAIAICSQVAQQRVTSGFSG